MLCWQQKGCDRYENKDLLCRPGSGAGAGPGSLCGGRPGLPRGGVRRHGHPPKRGGGPGGSRQPAAADARYRPGILCLRQQRRQPAAVLSGLCLRRRGAAVRPPQLRAQQRKLHRLAARRTDGQQPERGGAGHCLDRAGRHRGPGLAGRRRRRRPPPAAGPAGRVCGRDAGRTGRPGALLLRQQVRGRPDHHRAVPPAAGRRRGRAAADAAPAGAGAERRLRPQPGAVPVRLERH